MIDVVLALILFTLAWLLLMERDRAQVQHITPEYIRVLMDVRGTHHDVDSQQNLFQGSDLSRDANGYG